MLLHFFRPTVYIHPLCTENFEDMLLRTEPGVRTIVILVDEESRHKLLEQFAAVVHPYSRLVPLLNHITALQFIRNMV